MDGLPAEAAVSGFDDPAHEVRLRATIAARLGDNSLPIPHADAMARIDAIIAAAEKRS